MARAYSAPFKAVAVTVAQDFFEILAATAKPILICGWHIGQYSDAGDAAAELISVSTTRGVGSVTSGSGGSTVTPQPTDDPDTASGATVETNNTTRMAAGSGSLEVLEAYAVNVQVGMLQWYPPEMRPRIVPGDRWTLSLEVAPTDSLTMNGTVWFLEV